MSDATPEQIGHTEWTEAEFRQMLADGEVSLACQECGHKPVSTDVGRMARELVRHYQADHGYTAEQARGCMISVGITVHRCPRCDTRYRQPLTAEHAALSRTDDATYICNRCGQHEALEAAARGQVTAKADWPLRQVHTPTVHGFQSPDWRDQRSNRAHRPNPMPVPKEMPDLRLHLLERWVEGGPFDAMLAGRTSQYGYSRADLRQDNSWERLALRNASLWWIKSEMVDLTTAAARSVPTEVQAGEVDLPAGQPYGLAVLESPWWGIDADREDHRIEINAVLWGPARVEGQPALTMSMYRYIDFAGGLSADELNLAIETGIMDEAKQERIGQTVGGGAGIPDGSPSYRLYGGAWCWLGRSDWQLSETLTEIRTPHGPYASVIHGQWDTEQRRRSIEEDRRWFAALCVLVNHRLSETEPVYSARQTRRRAERAGVDRQQAASTVRIIRLREGRREHPDDSDPGERRHVEWSHRWLSSGHMGWRRCGPQHSQRRLVFVSPSVKGPKDKPLVVKENVRVWVK